MIAAVINIPESTASSFDPGPLGHFHVLVIAIVAIIWKTSDRAGVVRITQLVL